MKRLAMLGLLLLSLATLVGAVPAFAENTNVACDLSTNQKIMLDAANARMDDYVKLSHALIELRSKSQTNQTEATTSTFERQEKNLSSELGLVQEETRGFLAKVPRISSHAVAAWARYEKLFSVASPASVGSQLPGYSDAPEESAKNFADTASNGGLFFSQIKGIFQRKCELCGAPGVNRTRATWCGQGYWFYECDACHQSYSDHDPQVVHNSGDISGRVSCEGGGYAPTMP
jgi:hypothetical protein